MSKRLMKLQSYLVLAQEGLQCFLSSMESESLIFLMVKVFFWE